MNFFRKVRLWYQLSRAIAKAPSHIVEQAVTGLGASPHETRARLMDGRACTLLRHEADGWVVAVEGSQLKVPHTYIVQ